MDVTLVVISPDGSQHEYAVKRARQTIGRNKTCDLRVAVPEVSREHCELVVEGQRVIVRDLGSANGTFVNRHRVQETELSAGDVIRVGPATIVVRVAGKPEVVDSAKVLAGTTPGSTMPGRSDRPTVMMPAPSSGADANDESSMMDFEFDLDDEDEPKL